MINYEKDKFLVINRKRFDELFKAMVEKKVDRTIFYDLAAALQDFYEMYKELVSGKKLDHTYYVVNADEPYAEAVWALIKDDKAPPGIDENPVYRQELLNLLAILHRDGGHYVAKYGVKRAVADAIKAIYQDRSTVYDRKHDSDAAA